MWIIYTIAAVAVALTIANLILERKNTLYGVTFVAGNIGSGKSCYAAKVARQYLKRGWNVYSTDYIDGCLRLNVEELVEKCAEPDSLLIIDEAALKMNSRSFAKLKMETLEYYKLSRHFRNKILLISQTFTDTDKQIRDLSHEVLFIRRIINGVLSVPVRVKGDITIGEDGQPTISYKIGQFGKPLLLPLYYKYYQSFGDVSRPLIERKAWKEEKIPSGELLDKI